MLTFAFKPQLWEILQKSELSTPGHQKFCEWKDVPIPNRTKSFNFGDHHKLQIWRQNISFQTVFKSTKYSNYLFLPVKFQEKKKQIQLKTQNFSDYKKAEIRLIIISSMFFLILFLSLEIHQTMFSLCLLWSDDFVFLVKHSSHSCGTALALAGMATLNVWEVVLRAAYTRNKITVYK